MPSNREWVTIGSFLALAVLMLALPSTRAFLPGLAKAALNRYILPPVVFLSAWTAALVWGGRKLGIWDAALTTSTVLWFLTVGLVFLANAATDARTKPRFFLRTVGALLRISALLGVYVSLVALPLPIEVVLQLFVLLPTVVLVTFLQARGERSGCLLALNGVLALTGIALVFYVTVQLATAAQDWRSLLEGVLLPVWLTIGLIPFLYPLAVFSADQFIVSGIRGRAQNHIARKQRIRIWLALITGLGLRIRTVPAFSEAERGLTQAASFAEARAIVQTHIR